MPCYKILNTREKCTLQQKLTLIQVMHLLQYPYRMSQIDVHTLSQQRNDTVHSQQRRRTERHTVRIVANGISLMACSIWSLSSSSVCGFLAYAMFFKVLHWISWHQFHENIALMTLCKNLHQHSRYQWNFSFFCTDLSTHLAQFHRLRTCLGFLLLLPLVVMYQIQLSNFNNILHFTIRLQ